MGCGASHTAADADAASAVDAARDVASGPLSGVAASVAGSAAGALVESGGDGRVADAVAVATGGSSALGSAPGELLLGVAQNLPFVAPVAFLIGAVISAAASAKTLKADCAEFSKFVASTEAVCQEAALQGALDKAQDAVVQLRSALEEGL
jgi:hypothetical protein